MSGIRKSLLGAVAVGSAIFGASAALASGDTPSSKARLDELLGEIEAQKTRLDEQAKQLEAERQRLLEQAEELERMRAAMSNEIAQPNKLPSAIATRATKPATPKSAFQAAPGEPSNAVATRTGIGRTAKTKFSTVETAKADLAIGQQDQDRPEEKQEPHKRATLRDVVRRAIAPTLSAQTEVGQRPEGQDDEIDIAVIADRGGVLTPRGTLVLDLAMDYSHSSVNRFFFDGVEVVDTVLIGILEAQDIDRNSFSTSFGARYGLTRRMEINARTNWSYRDDRLSTQAVDESGSSEITETDGSGFGDIDFGVNYQINKPKGNFPYFVANARFKSNTGKGPFDVDRDLQTALETELPTGSGFWTIEPSLTMIYPSDPAVLFASIGYQYTVDDNVDELILDRCVITLTDLDPQTGEGIQGAPGDAGFPDECGTAPGVATFSREVRRYGNVDPGDVISASIGMGIGLNDSVSLSLGYEHNWVFGTETEQFIESYEDGILIADDSGRFISESSDVQVGALLIGAAVNVAPNVGFNVNVAIGVTADSPDVRLAIRTPLSWKLFKN